jgi:hypothetical protein
MRLTGSHSPPTISWTPARLAFAAHADRGADPTILRAQRANPRGHIALRVFLRITAMDVCCGPPHLPA